MQAIAAAMFGGRSNDDGSALGPASGGGGGWDGATGSGMTHIHKLGGGFVNTESCRGRFSLSPPGPNQYRGLVTAKACRGIHSKAIRVITPQTAMESQP